MDLERVIQDDIKLNKLDLDSAAEEQASIFYYWSELLADKRKEKDKTDDALDYLQAEKTLFYCVNPKTDIKPTADNVKSMVQSDHDVVVAKNKLRDLEHDVNVLFSAVNSMEQKAKQIDNLRHLQISGYYSISNPRVGKQDDIANEARAGLNRRKD